MDDQRQKRMRAFAEVLARLYKTSVNHAAEETEISREALTKLSRGRPCELPQLEQFARRSGLDVNEWRALYGYEPVLNHTHAFLDDIEAIRRETGVNFTVSADELLLVRESPDMLRQYAEAIRRRVMERQQRGA